MPVVRVVCCTDLECNCKLEVCENNNLLMAYMHTIRQQTFSTCVGVCFCINRMSRLQIGDKALCVCLVFILQCMHVYVSVHSAEHVRFNTIELYNKYLVLRVVND